MRVIVTRLVVFSDRSNRTCARNTLSFYRYRNATSNPHHGARNEFGFFFLFLTTKIENVCRRRFRKRFVVGMSSEDGSETGEIDVFVRSYRSIISFVVTPSHLTAPSRDEWGVRAKHVYEDFDPFVLFNNGFDREFQSKTVLHRI